MQTIKTVDELAAYVKAQHAAGIMVYIRYSNGPAADRAMGRSLNHVTGRREAGLSVGNLIVTDAEWMMDEDQADYWRRHIASMVRSYSFLPGKPYILTGDVVGFGSDGEPLLANWRQVARMSPTVLAEADQIRPTYVPIGAEWLYEGMS